MRLTEFTNIERLEIIEETNSSYKVKYQNNIYEFIKDTESYFDSGTSQTLSMKQELVLEQRIISENKIFQDETVPKEVKEIMMFHEIRELEYKENGLEDAHRRAVNDEIIYISKFFENKINDIFEFIIKYRGYNGLIESYPIKSDKLFEITYRHIFPDGISIPKIEVLTSNKKIFFDLKLKAKLDGIMEDNVKEGLMVSKHELEEEINLEDGRRLFERYILPTHRIFIDDNLPLLTYAKIKDIFIHIIPYEEDKHDQKINEVLKLINIIKK